MGGVYSAEIAIDELDYLHRRMNQYSDYIWATNNEIPGPLYVNLNVSDDYYNKKMVLYQDAGNSESWYLSVPKKLEGKTMLAYRDVLYASPNRVMVVLTEAYPVSGRVWTNFYDYENWSGWKCTALQDEAVLWDDGYIRFVEDSSVNLRKSVSEYSHVMITYFVQSNSNQVPKRSYNTVLIPVMDKRVVQSVLTGTQFVYTSYMGIEITDATLYTRWGKRYYLSGGTLETNYGNQLYITKIEGVNL